MGLFIRPGSPTQKLLKVFTVKGFSALIICLLFSGTPVGYTAIQKIKRIMNRQISKEEFKKEVINTSVLSLVQFKTEWSGACQIISPVYKELAKSYKGQANFFTVDIEKETGIDIKYGVMELPTILFFRNGEVIDHIKGLMPKNIMITKIENALSSVLN